MRPLLCLGVLPLLLAAEPQQAPPVLSAPAATQLVENLKKASAHGKHIWRDTPPFNDDGTINAYIEISRGDRRKWEFDMRLNRRAIDRVMPRGVGGYPVNYGFVPQTISYDGDPFDALVLGPALPAGVVVRALIVGLMYMEDEAGLDSKVVLSLSEPDGRPRHAITDSIRRDIDGYFSRYKRHEPGKFSRVPGWGDASIGLAYVETTHAFFHECRSGAGSPCALTR
jgi:inorganic pyrophosphatase